MAGGEDLITRYLADLHNRVRPSNQTPKGNLAKFTAPMDAMTAADAGVTAKIGTAPFTWAGFVARTISSAEDWAACTGTFEGP